MASLTARDAHAAPGDGARSDTPRPSGPLSFAGRIGVLGANARLLVATIALGVAGALAGALFAADVEVVRGAGDAFTLFRPPIGLVLVSGVSALVALPFTVSALVLRCHDRGHSGWWLLLVLVPVVGMLFLLYLLVWPGADEPNRFGPQRRATALERLGGVLGLALSVSILVVAAVSFRGFRMGSFDEMTGPRGVSDSPAGSEESGTIGPLEVR